MVLASAVAAVAHATPIETAFPTFGGAGGTPPSLNACAVSGDTLFLAGSVRWAGPLTGGGVPVGRNDLYALTGFPRVNGHVLAVTPDGEGGWYLGGSFTHVGGLPPANPAHIRADLGVDPWAPSTNSDVVTILATSTEVYIAGTFTSVNGEPSAGFAAVERSTGAITLDPAMSGLVTALACDGTTLYLGGEFTFANGTARSRLAAFRLADHQLMEW